MTVFVNATDVIGLGIFGVVLAFILVKEFIVAPLKRRRDRKAKR